MVTGIEILALVVVLVFFLGAATVVRAAQPFIVNAVIGLLTIFVAESVLGISIAVTPIVLVIVALGGFPGALLALLLALFDVAFLPALL